MATNLEVFDEIRLGDDESERAHRGLCGWGERAQDGSYKHGDIAPRDLKGMPHARNFAGMVGFEMKLPESYDPSSLVFELVMDGMPYRSGGYAKPFGAGRVMLLSGDRAVEIGELPSKKVDEWVVLRFTIPEGVIERPSLHILLNDLENCGGYRDFWGRTVACGRLLGRRSASMPRVEAARCAKETRERDVLLVMCPTWDVRMPPLPLVCLASYLSREGHSSEVLDINIEMYREFGKEYGGVWSESNALQWDDEGFRRRILEEFGPRLEEYARFIAEYRTRFVGFSVNCGNRVVTLALARRIKELNPHKRLIFGGPLVSLSNPAFFGEDWDCLVIGEGEEPLLRILREPEIPLEKSIVRRDSRWERDLRRDKAFVANIDSLPLLDFSCVNLMAYDNPTWLPMYMSRGCVNRCLFCNDWVLYNPFRQGSGEWACRQIVNLVKNFGAVMVPFSDLICNGDLRKLREFGERLAASGVKVRWSSYATVRAEMTPELLEILRESGCICLQYGIESGSTQTLKAMRKGHTREEAGRVIRMTYEAGIQVHINLMVGFPEETEEQFQETISFLEENAGVIDCLDAVNPLLIQPCSKMEAVASDLGIRLHPTDGRLWVGRNSDYTIRKDRLRRLLNKIPELGLIANVPLAY